MANEIVESPLPKIHAKDIVMPCGSGRSCVLSGISAMGGMTRLANFPVLSQQTTFLVGSEHIFEGAPLHLKFSLGEEPSASFAFRGAP